jgi:methyl-accepting chemotaxis protein
MVPSFFRHLSLRMKVYLNLALLCAALGTVSVLANWCIATVANLSEQALKKASRQAALASDVAEFTLECRRYEKDVFLNIRTPALRENYVKDWRNAFAQLTAAVEAFRDEAAAEDDQAAARKWTRLAGQYQEALQGVFRGVNEGTIRTPEQANEALTPFKESIRDLTELGRETSRRKIAEARQAENDLLEATFFFKTLILFVSLAAGIGCLIWCSLLAIDLVRPISALREAARRVRDGDPYTRVDLQRDDELGQLADCFNEMTAQLRERASQKDG